MKKNIFFLLLLAIIAMSCQESVTIDDGSFTPLTSKKSAYDSPKLFNSAAKAEEQRIIAFRNLLNDLKNMSSASPTGNEMAVDATVWNIEALLNASYASAGEPFARNAFKKDSISVPLNANGAVDESSLPAIYEMVRAKLGEQYGAVASANKHLIFVDIALKGTGNGTNFASPIPMADLYVTSSIGYELAPAEDDFAFGPVHNWFWSKRRGMCNPVDGSLTGRLVGNSASSLLVSVLNQRYPRPLDRDYYTDIQQFGATEMDNPNDISTIPPASRPLTNPTGKDNIRDYLIYSVSEEYPYDIPGQSNYGIKSCIEAADMNWYYQNYFNEITKSRNNFHKDFISATIIDFNHYHKQPMTDINHTVLSHVLLYSLGNYHRSTHCQQMCACDDTSCIPNCNISTF